MTDRRHERYRAERREEAVRLYGKHRSLRIVALKMGVSHERVRQYLVDAGMQRDPRGRKPQK